MQAHRALQGEPVAEAEREHQPALEPEPMRIVIEPQPPRTMTDWELAEDMAERARGAAGILKQQEAEAAKLRDPCRAEPAPAWVSDCGVV